MRKAELLEISMSQNQEEEGFIVEHIYESSLYNLVLDNEHLFTLELLFLFEPSMYY